jgi:hypothetical protein
MSPEIVRTRFRDLEFDKRADRQLAGHKNETIDLRGMPTRAPDGYRLAAPRFVFRLELSDRLDQHL